MDIVVKCEKTPEMIKAEYEAINARIEDENRKCSRKRLKNCFFLLMVDIMIFLFVYISLKLPDPSFKRIFTALMLPLPAIFINLLLIDKCRGIFLGIEKCNIYEIKEKIKNAKYFTDLSSKNILDVKLEEDVLKEKLDIIIEYADLNKKVIRETVRNFKKVEILDLDKYIIDFDERTVTVPYVKKEGGNLFV